MNTIRWILFLIQIGALWLVFSGQVDGQWSPLIVLSQWVVLGLAFVIMRIQHKAAGKAQVAHRQSRYTTTVHPSGPIPLRESLTPSLYEEQPQAIYADRNT